MTLPAAGYFTDPARTNGEAKQAQDDMLGTLLAFPATVGDVTGPASSTAGNLPSFSDTGGKVLEDSGVAASDVLLGSNNLSDLASFSTARTNLSVYSKEEVDALGAGSTMSVTAGEAIDTSSIPKLVYKDVFNQRGGGASRWYLVDTDATSPVRISPVVGIATTSAAGAGNTFTCQVQHGQVSGFTGLTADAMVWASSAAGAITQTEPPIPGSGTQNAVRVVGYALSATAIMFEPWHDTVFQAYNSTLAAGASMTIEGSTDAGARERVARAYLAQTAPAGTDVLPAFSGYASGTWTISSSNDSNGAAWKVGDNSGNSDDCWNTNAAQGQWVRFDNSGAAVSIAGYTIKVSSSYASRGPQNWTAELWNGSSWTVIDTQANAPVWSANEERSYTLSNSYAIGSGNYAAVRLNIANHYGGTTLIINEVQLLQAQTARDEPLTIGSEQINSDATDRMTVRFDDGAGSNADTKTTFINRTNGPRKIVAEVTL